MSLSDREQLHKKWVADRASIGDNIQVDNSRENLINMAMKDFLNNNYKQFENFVVRDSEASVWMLMNEPLVLSANMDFLTLKTLIDMLHQQIIYGGKEIQTTGTSKRPIQEMKRLKSILESINKTNKIISYLHSNGQNVNEFIQKYSLPQLIELEHNILQKRYPRNMFSFVTDLLPRLRLEIQAKIIDVAAEGRKSEGGFKRSAKKYKKCRRSQKTKSRRH